MGTPRVLAKKVAGPLNDSGELGDVREQAPEDVVDDVLGA
jgi:hypothetical protein